MRKAFWANLVLGVALVCPLGSALADNFSLTFVGREYSQSTDSTEFSYELCWDGVTPGLSHFVLGVAACRPALDVLEGGDPLQGCQSPGDPALDGSTGLFGIKWDNCEDSFDSENCSAQTPCCDTFSVVIDGNHGEDTGLWLAKAGPCDLSSCDRGETTVPACEDGNIPPVCDVGGPYDVACGEGVGVVQLDASGSVDPDGQGSSSSSSSSSSFETNFLLGDDDDDFDPVCEGLTFSWQTNCPGGSFDDASSATPILTFNTEHAPGVPLSCTATVTVTDCDGETSECSSVINVGDCTFDCAGTLNGPAVFDECGVCEGTNSDIDQCGVCFGNNQTLDECGVCDGMNQDKDVCGVCFGDNSTCDPVCQETLIIEELFALDGLGFEYSGFISNLSKKVKKLSGGKQSGAAEAQQAKDLYLANWGLTWSLPQTVLSNCTFGELCVTVDNTSTLASYSSNHDQFGGLAATLIKKIKNLGGSVTKLNKRKNKLDKQDEVLISQVPGTTQSCGSPE